MRALLRTALLAALAAAPLHVASAQQNAAAQQRAMLARACGASFRQTVQLMMAGRLSGQQATQCWCYFWEKAGSNPITMYKGQRAADFCPRYLVKAEPPVPQGGAHTVDVVPQGNQGGNAPGTNPQGDWTQPGSPPPEQVVPGVPPTTTQRPPEPKTPVVNAPTTVEKKPQTPEPPVVWSGPPPASPITPKTESAVSPPASVVKDAGIADERGTAAPLDHAPAAPVTAREDHYFAGLTGCDSCVAYCTKPNWPKCQQGDVRNHKDTILKTLVLADGTRYVKIQVHQDICNTVSCHSYANSIASPVTGLKICCTYKQWQSESFVTWSYPVTDQTGTVASYKRDVSAPCSCGQIYDAALDAQLADGLAGRQKFEAAVARICPALPQSGLAALIKSCKFAKQDVAVGGLDVNNVMNALIGLFGAAVGESGPGWSHPEQPTITPPTSEPAPGTKSGYPRKPRR